MGYLDGFAVTFKKLFKRSDTGRVVTVDFPREKTARPNRLHGSAGKAGEDEEGWFILKYAIPQTKRANRNSPSARRTL